MTKTLTISLGILTMLGILGTLTFAPPGAAAPPDPPEPTPYPQPGMPEELDLRSNHLSGRWFDPRESSAGTFEIPFVTAQTLAPTGPPVIAAEVVTGAEYTCVRSVSGGVRCWGENNLGQLGNGTTTNNYLPGDVLKSSQRSGQLKCVP